MIMNNCIDQSDFEDTVEQAEYIFSDHREKLIMNYIDKVKIFKSKIVKKTYKNQESYEEKIVNKLKSLFENELKIDEILRSETPTLPYTKLLSPKKNIRSKSPY